MNPKMAVYTHMVLFKVRKEEVVQRTRKTYSGPLEVGEDLMSFDVGETIRVNRSRRAGLDIVPDL